MPLFTVTCLLNIITTGPDIKYLVNKHPVVVNQMVIYNNSVLHTTLKNVYFYKYKTTVQLYDPYNPIFEML
jgi:hypothetical protein